MGSTEQCIFASLRSRFDRDEQGGGIAAPSSPQVATKDKVASLPLPLRRDRTFKWLNGQLLSDRDGVRQHAPQPQQQQGQQPQQQRSGSDLPTPTRIPVGSQWAA